ncbi:MAG: HDIG domain-containing protein [bacterium]|nr:HDIG domain-containing protein [bacterium]
MRPFGKLRTAKSGGGGKRPRRQAAAGRLRTFLEQSRAVKGLITAATCAGIVAIVAMGRTPHRELVDLYVGQPASRDIFADIEFTYVNRGQTERLRGEAAQKVLPRYAFSAARLADYARTVRELLGLAEAAEAVEAAAKGDTPRPPILSAKDLEPIRGLPDPAGLAAQMESLLAELAGPRAAAAAERTLSEGRGAPGVEPHLAALLKAAQEQVDRWANERFPRDRRARDAAAAVLRTCAEAAVEYDEATTRRLKEEAAARVRPVVTRVLPGKKIVDRGYEVTPEQMDAYLAYITRREQEEPAVVKMRERLSYLLGLTLMVVMFIIVSRRYLMYYQERVYRSNSTLCMVALIALGSLLMSRAITFIPFGTIQSAWNNLFFYGAIVSVPMAAILITLLVNRTLALFLSILIGIFVGVMRGMSLPYTLVSAVGGAIAVYSTIGVRRRSQLVRAGATIGLANVITIGAIDAIGNVNIISASVGFRVAGGYLLGILSAFFAASLLPLFEHVFNVVTDIRLLELSDLNHPLLKRMFIEAPGTYHHSLMVGNLAEAAAEAVGANPLQARVCAYFHDIGKMGKPEYFTENQTYGASRHDKLNPQMSSLVIRSHVKDGLDMALRYKLSRPIINAIREHHGTGLVYYFYRRAEEEAQAEGEEVAQEDYRYGGPRPRSKETAILLLADAVEAASRSLDRPTPSRVTQLVWKIISQRIVDGQLNECDLTFNDIRLVAERFEHILNSTFHTRVKYPERGEPSGAGTADESVGGEPAAAPED